MDYITNIDNIPEKIAISSPFIIYICILLFGILNQQLEMSAVFMFGVLFLYSVVCLFQMFYSVDNNHNDLNPNKCQFFDQHLFYQSYQIPSFPSSFLCFVFFSIIITFITSTYVNIPLIILSVFMSIIIILRMKYTSSCYSTNKLRFRDAGISLFIGGFIAFIYYFLIVHLFMKMDQYMLFVRPKSSRKQCVNITKIDDSRGDV